MAMITNEEWDGAVEENSDQDCTDYRGVCEQILKSRIGTERVKSRFMGVDDGMRACEKVINAARLFCESTAAEMNELEGTESAAAPAEFMLLHEAVQEFDGTCK